MSLKLWAVMALSFVVAVAGTGSADAAEQLIASQQAFQSNGSGQIVHLRRMLALPRTGRVNSVIFVAASSYGRGQVDVLANGLVVGGITVGPLLEAQQVPVNQDLGAGLQTLQLRTQGQITFALVGVTFDDYATGPVPPPPGPVVPPPPSRPTCDVLGAGPYNGLNWNYRISVRNSLIDAADRLDDLIKKIRLLEQAGACMAYPTECTLGGASHYRGLSWNFVLRMNGEPVDAADSMRDVITKVTTLRQAGLCSTRSYAPQSCQLMGAGTYRGLRWNYLIGIGSEVVDASDRLDEATSKIEQLRNQSFCI